MKLSVIIPVYRVEDTLDCCVESVAAQTYSDMEIILVDDGSPDNCPQKCDEWAQKDLRVRVVHKQNGGLSDARNAGIDVARGEFVTFVDSDDFLASGTYDRVMPTAQENDITEYPIFRHYGAAWQKRLDFGSAIYTSGRDYWLRGRGYEHSYFCNKIFRRKLFSGVRFPVGKVFEDVATIPMLLQRAESIATTGDGLYYYCMNGQGITATAQGRQLQMLLDAHLAVMEQWIDDRYYMHVLNIQSDVYELTDCPPILPRRRVSPLAEGLTTAQRLKALALCVLGLERTCKLNKSLHRWKKPDHS